MVRKETAEVVTLLEALDHNSDEVIPLWPVMLNACPLGTASGIAACAYGRMSTGTHTVRDALVDREKAGAQHHQQACLQKTTPSVTS